MKHLNPAPGFVQYPNHKVALNTSSIEYQVTFAGHEIARSARAIVVQEGEYLPRPYFPVEDVKAEFLTANDHTTYCPFKGEARYWNVSVGEDLLENGAWAYDVPYDECAKITGYICFYTEKSPFELIEVSKN